MKTRKTQLSYTARTGFTIQKGRMRQSKKYYLGHEKSAAESKAFLIDRIYSVELNEDPKSGGSIIEFNAQNPTQSKRTQLNQLILDRRTYYCRQIAQYGRIVDISNDLSCPFLATLEQLKIVAFDSLEKPISITKLQDAVDAYEKYRIKEYVGKEVGKDRVRGQIKELRSSLPEVHLSECTHDWNQSFINDYRKRKTTAFGNRCSKTWAENQISEFKNMSRWIARNFDEYPKQTFEFDTNVMLLASDDAKNHIKELYYSMEDLKKIYAAAASDDIRLMIALALNTCGSSAEIGRYKVSDFVLGKKHPNHKVINFDHVGDWLYTTREKTHSHISHVLWSWVSELVRKRILECKAKNWVYLFSDPDGLPRYRDKDMYDALGLEWKPTKKPEKFFYDQFDNTTKNLELSIKLPFKMLRKQFSNYLAAEDSETSSLALSHNVGTDKLLSHYANKPYRRLFEQTLQAEEHWQLAKAIGNQ
jgi:hypothetical protein